MSIISLDKKDGAITSIGISIDEKDYHKSIISNDNKVIKYNGTIYLKIPNIFNLTEADLEIIEVKDIICVLRPICPPTIQNEIGQYKIQQDKKDIQQNNNKHINYLSTVAKVIYDKYKQGIEFSSRDISIILTDENFTSVKRKKSTVSTVICKMYKQKIITRVHDSNNYKYDPPRYSVNKDKIIELEKLIVKNE